MHLICRHVRGGKEGEREGGTVGEVGGRGRGRREDEGGNKCLQTDSSVWSRSGGVEGGGVGSGVSTVQRTFEMAHLAAASCTPRCRLHCHHLHTSYEMKMDGESRRRRRRRFIKVTQSSKTPQNLFSRPLLFGILTHQRASWLCTITNHNYI